MAAKTFAQLYTDALLQADELTGSGTATAKTIIKAGINEAYSDIAAARDWKILEDDAAVTTTSGTMEYTPVTSSSTTPRIRRIQSVLDETNNRYLQEVTRDDFERDYPYVDTTSANNLGQPTYWFSSGYDSNRDLKIKLYQVPNSTLSLRVFYFFEPVELSADADIPLIPDQYHYGLTYLGLAKYYEYQKDPIASYYRALYEDYKRKILDAEYGETDEMPSMQPQTRNRGYVIGKIGRVYN